jgi:intracellular septation protein
MTKPDTAAATETGRSLAKFLIEFAPLLAFFLSYRFFGIFEATAVLMATTLFSLIAAKIFLKHVTPMLGFTAIIVCTFGALSLWFNDPRFIKVKPTIVNLVFAAVLFGGLLTGRSLLKMLMGEALQLDDAGWRKFTLRWALFFCFVAGLNEVVWRNFDESTWVTFKFVGILGLTFIFLITQLPLLQRHRIVAADQSQAG